MELIQKLAILADGAKYDASCASSGAAGRKATQGGIGSTTGMGICHSYTPDGRCVSLLKVLLTNFCIYDCLYCINRRSSNVSRARFSIEELVQLCLAFYRRNYIEGLFLSSGIIRNGDYTMEQLIAVARCLREEHDFQGYIHLKTIPEAAPELLAEAGLYADRLSINVELPTRQALGKLAPDKDFHSIGKSMGVLRQHIASAGKISKTSWIAVSGNVKKEPELLESGVTSVSSNIQPLKRRGRKQRFAPAGQSTQMIIGADPSSDLEILRTSYHLYQQFFMRRVYYSAFSPIQDASPALPPVAPPLLREHRLYQADWLLRFYEFKLDEIMPQDSEQMLDLEIDPKLSWALNHPEFFPVDINRASRKALLRVPGLGPRNVARILSSRRFQKLRLEHLRSLGVSIKKARHFISAQGHLPAAEMNPQQLRGRFANKPEQLPLW